MSPKIKELGIHLLKKSSMSSMSSTSKLKKNASFCRKDSVTSPTHKNINKRGSSESVKPVSMKVLTKKKLDKQTEEQLYV